MHNSVKGEYALQAILDLASRRAGEPIRIADIAQRQKIPQKFLELILASLKQGGFVESRRGAEGGYLLARPADSITVGEVTRFVEGPHHGRTRPRRDAAPLRFLPGGRGPSFRGGAPPRPNASPPRRRDALLRSVAAGGPRRGGDRRPSHLCRPAARLDRETEQARPELGDLSWAASRSEERRVGKE